MVNPESLYNAILHGDAKGATDLVRQALEQGVDPEVLVSQQQMIRAMDEVGRLFDQEEYFVPELLLSARAMKGALELIRPLLVERGAKPVGRAVIGTVQGDLHDIGKNLVGAMLEGGGFDVIDLGADVAPEGFVAAVKETGASVLCMSALLTVTMPAMNQTIEALAKAGLRDNVKVIVGGAPLSQEFAQAIGADAFGPTAASAVTLARELIE